MEQSLVEQSNSDSYMRDLRGIVRQLHGGELDYDQAFDLVWNTIQLGLTSAWYEGAKECGIFPNELTPEERLELGNSINIERGFIHGLLVNAEEEDAKISDLLKRANRFGLRYADVRTRAMLMACEDQKLKWVINHVRVVEKNCASCLKLNGKIKRASYWRKKKIQPQHPPNSKLDCGGWECGCGLVQTDEPASRGPLPGLP